MSDDYLLFHNPRCSKSRAALALLGMRGITPRLVRYLDTPPGADALRLLLRRLELPARDLLRSGEAAYAALGLNDPALDEDAIIDAMAAHPELIERPVLVRGERAVIGRPTERLLTLLD
ncbi:MULTISPECIES: arsenate reductase (glutaredoxin) [Luteimonas]|uniref:Arsenate reductase n=1 Tax=Luteimonas chenhongjianii TaxID=2006110 RepID=A0A290XDW2_9GAMM|nr:MULTISPECIES: arsenate reductase (glutaredoxin) [Luteimonas]ATD67332.1 arsenate reductase (glutaredoxin) [Luteimonas chenhongjianii]RPD86567.1 arsenate reductase (glutaredoxin) [Luteimonas sp. 100069]